jgi:hypothetical protein
LIQEQSLASISHPTFERVSAYMVLLRAAFVRLLTALK